MKVNLTMAAALAVAVAPLCGGGNAAIAGTINENFRYDNTEGQNQGGNVTAASFTYTLTGRTDPETGVSFDVSMTIDGIGGNLITNGGTNDREFGIQGGNNAIDQATEGVFANTAVISNIDYNGLDPSKVDVSFDGFTSVLLFFSGNDGDAAQVQADGSVVFQFEGTLDPLGADFADTVVSIGDGLQTYGVMGQHAVNTNNAEIDLTGSLPQTVTVMSVDHSGGGATAPGDPNRIRVDDFRAQFTVTVVPEPGSLMLLSAMAGVFGLAGALRYRWG